MTHPPPRPSTLVLLDGAAWRIGELRASIETDLLDAYEQIDRLRAESARWEARARAAEVELVRVIKEASDGRR